MPSLPGATHKCDILICKSHVREIGEERIYLTYLSIVLEAGADRGQGGVCLTDLFYMACLAYFLIEPRTSSPGVTPPIGVAPPIMD